MVGKKLKGSTILEILIAIIIISSALGIGLYSLARLDNTRATGAEKRMEQYLAEVLEETLYSERYFSEIIDHKGVEIQKSIIPTSNDRLLILKLKGIIDDKTISTKHQLVELGR